MSTTALLNNMKVIWQCYGYLFAIQKKIVVRKFSEFAGLAHYIFPFFGSSPYISLGQSVKVGHVLLTCVGYPCSIGQLGHSRESQEPFEFEINSYFHVAYLQLFLFINLEVHVFTAGACEVMHYDIGTLTEGTKSLKGSSHNNSKT